MHSAANLVIGLYKGLDEHIIPKRKQGKRITVEKNSKKVITVHKDWSSSWIRTESFKCEYEEEDLGDDASSILTLSEKESDKHSCSGFG